MTEPMGIIAESGVLVEEEYSQNIKVTKDGYLLCEAAPIARLGIQDYTPEEAGFEGAPDGNAYLVRMKEEVHSPESMASWVGKPITDGHPTEMVTSLNWSKYAKGQIVRVWAEGSLIRADLLITDADLIAKVNSRGLRKLSCGYYSKVLPLEQGVAEQVDIIGNHVALVLHPRAGDICSIIDSRTINSSNPINPKQERKMANKQKLKSIFTMLGFKDGYAENLASDVMDEEDSDTNTETDITDSEADEKAEDAIYADLIKRIEALEALNKQVEVTDSEEEKDCTDEEELKDEDEDEDEDEDDSSFTDSRPQFEILLPGFKPTGKDAKRAALKQVALTDSKSIASLVKGRNLETLSADAIDVIFDAAVEMKRGLNNHKVVQPTSYDFLDMKPDFDFYAAYQDRYEAGKTKQH